MPPPAGLAPIFRVFSHRNFAFYMGGMAPNLITIWMQRLGVGWLAWKLTHSTSWLGVIAAADLIPMLFLAPIAGAITDRGVPLRLQKITQFLAVFHALGLGIFTLAGWIDIWLLLAFTLFLGCSHTLASTARHAIVPATVPRAELATAVGIDSALFNASRFIGPAAAGLVIPLAGIGGTFIANVVGCVVFFAALFFMDLAPPEREKRGRRSVFADIRESLHYVRGHAGIGPLFLLLTAISVLYRPVQDMMPGFAGAVFKSDAVGLAWLTGGLGAGATVSAAWIALRNRVGGLTVAVVAACLMLAMGVVGMVATPVLWVAVAFTLVAGFALNTVSTGTQALVQYAMDDAYRGRVMGLYTLIYRGTPAVGALALGFIAERAGLRGTFGVAAVLGIAVWLATLSRRITMRRALEHEPA